MRDATIKVNGERLCPEDLLEKPELTIGLHGLSEPRKRLPLGQGLIRRLLRLFFDFGERKSGFFSPSLLSDTSQPLYVDNCIPFICPLYTGPEGCEK